VTDHGNEEPTVSAKMPELGDLRIGDEVIVIENPSARTPRHTRARVVKAAAVWIDVEPVEDRYMRETRFRRDNQTAKARPEHWTPHFYTEEQWAWQQRVSQAHEYLKEIGVSARLESRFSDDPLALANVIRRGLGEPEL
jgi:hypothetical protein